MQDARSRNPDILPADDAEATRTAEQPHPYDRSTTFIPAPADLKEGQIFGAYRLVRRLGQGGFGEVWEAEHQRTKRLLALKVLIAARQRSPEAVERFEREGKLAASVSHPRCVFVFGAEEIAGYPVITMELMRGGTLRDRVSSQGPMPPQQAVDSILDIIEGLEAAHRAGLLHRDVKPSNCFLDETGRAKIGDFGISKALEDQSDLTITGTFVGTPSYAAPEQVRGLEVGIQSDIYAVGATLYTLLTGAPPFKGHNAADVFGRVIAEPPAPFATYSVQVPGSLERVVLRAMAKDKARRFQSYEEFRNALVSFSSSRPAMASVGRRVFAYYVDLLPFFALMNWLAGPARTAWGGATFQDVSRSPTLLSLVPFATAASLFFLYLTLTERCWNRTVGKYLMGLRVTTSDGSRLTLGRILLRTSVFGSGVFVSNFLPDLSSWDPFLGFSGSWRASFLIFYPMCRRNGYAGLHEVVSRTRTVATAKRDAVAVPTLPRGSVESRDSIARQIGPYRVVKPIWSGEFGALSLARDDLLERDVWIHEHSAKQSQPIATLTEARPGRLHWLNGSRDGAVCWDAYGVPSGIDLSRWVEQRGRLSWAEVRTILPGVLKEIVALGKSAQPAFRFSVNRLWVDADCQPKLLNFPMVEEGSAGQFKAHEWRAFIRATTFFALEGQPDGAPGASAAPRVPLPVYAQPVIQRICASSENRSIVSLLGDLAAIEDRPPHVTRVRRGIPMLLMAAGAALVAVAGDPSPGADAAMARGSVSAVFAFILTLMLGTVPLFRPAGIGLQTGDGRRAGRVRCLLRALIAWSPYLFCLLLISKGILWPALIVGALILAGALFALARPARGIPDLVAGTHLVVGKRSLPWDRWFTEYVLGTNRRN